MRKLRAAASSAAPTRAASAYWGRGWLNSSSSGRYVARLPSRLASPTASPSTPSSGRRAESVDRGPEPSVMPRSIPARAPPPPGSPGPQLHPAAALRPQLAAQALVARGAQPQQGGALTRAGGLQLVRAAL